MSERPFRVLGIQQIAVGGSDKQRLRRLWVDTFGLEVIGDYRSESENVDEDIAVLGSGPLRVEVDLMQPLDPDRKPAVNSPPLNHVGLWIDDLRAAVAWLEERGVRFTPGGSRRSRRLLHPSEGQRRVPALRRRRADRAGAGPARGAGSLRPPALTRVRPPALPVQRQVAMLSPTSEPVHPMTVRDP